MLKYQLLKKRIKMMTINIFQRGGDRGGGGCKFFELQPPFIGLGERESTCSLARHPPPGYGPVRGIHILKVAGFPITRGLWGKGEVAFLGNMGGLFPTWNTGGEESPLILNFKKRFKNFFYYPPPWKVSQAPP